MGTFHQRVVPTAPGSLFQKKGTFRGTVAAGTALARRLRLPFDAFCFFLLVSVTASQARRAEREKKDVRRLFKKPRSARSGEQPRSAIFSQSERFRIRFFKGVFSD